MGKERRVALVKLSVPDISCEHCERAVKNALGSVEGIQQVDVDIPGKTVEVRYDRERGRRRSDEGRARRRGLSSRLFRTGGLTSNSINDDRPSPVRDSAGPLFARAGPDGHDCFHVPRRGSLSA